MMKGWLSFSSMETQKPYIAMVFVQCVYAGMALFSKASIDRGMSPFVFVFYRQAFASLALAPFTYFFERTKAPPPPRSYCLLCKIFFIALFGITFSLNLYYFALNYTSATLAAATPNVIPAITFIMAVLLRMESISVKHYYGVAKITGTIICLSGALVIAFYKGPSALKFMNNQNQTHEVSTDTSLNASSNKVDSWVKGALIMLSANTVWSLWLILQAPIIRRYPAKIHLTALQSCFSCIQSAIVAIVFERNPSSWKLGWNIHLLSVAYCGISVSGITYWLQVWCIEKKGPVFTALFTPLALMITVIFSSFLWKETIYWGSVCGALLLVGGLYSVLWGKNREEMGENKDEIRSETNKQIHDVNKDETILDCTTQPSPC